jgi:exosortase K
MKTNDKNLPYYFFAIALFIVLKFSFTFSDNNDLAFLLKPTDKLVGLLTASTSVYLADHGYYHDKLNIVIDKSCSGFNFMLLCFLMLAFLALKFFDRHLHKMLAIPITLFCGVLLTIFVNASRIFVSIIIQNHTRHFPVNEDLVHETIGIVTNLSFLILAYCGIEKLLTKRHHAKPAQS